MLPVPLLQKGKVCKIHIYFARHTEVIKLQQQQLICGQSSMQVYATMSCMYMILHLGLQIIVAHTEPAFQCHPLLYCSKTFTLHGIPFWSDYPMVEVQNRWIDTWGFAATWLLLKYATANNCFCSFNCRKISGWGGAVCLRL